MVADPKLKYSHSERSARPDFWSTLTKLNNLRKHGSTRRSRLEERKSQSLNDVYVLESARTHDGAVRETADSGQVRSASDLELCTRCAESGSRYNLVVRQLKNTIKSRVLTKVSGIHSILGDCEE